MRRYMASQGSGCDAQGPALVFHERFSARYDLDRSTGVITRLGHSLLGQSLADRVLLIPAVQGGVAGGWAFLAMRELGLSPAALVFARCNPVMIQGAVAAGIPVMSGIDLAALTEIVAGTTVHVLPSVLTLLAESTV